MSPARRAPTQLARHLVDEFLFLGVESGLMALAELGDLDPAWTAVIVEKVGRERASVVLLAALLDAALEDLLGLAVAVFALSIAPSWFSNMMARSWKLRLSVCSRA